MKIYFQPLIRLLLIAACSAGMQSIHSQTYTKSREVSKSFKSQKNSCVQIYNKYGNISIIPWAKDSVRFEVKIDVQAKQADKAQKIISSIDFEMNLFGNFVNAKTVFNDNQATFWKDVVSYAGQVLNTNNNLQIDYFVYMPSSLNLKIENKFGNIYMDNHQGMLNIILSNGDLQARNVGADLRLDLEFGTATFQDVLDAEFNVNYSDCSIQDAGNITFESRSSTIDIDKVTSLDIKSSRDKFNVKHCGSLTGTSVFSHIKLGEMGNITNLNTKYGDLKLNGIAKNFNAIQLNSQYTDLLLCLSPVSPCSIDLNYDNKTVLNFAPTLNSQLKKEVINSKTGSIHASGTYGKAGTSDISISTKAGSITFLLK